MDKKQFMAGTLAALTVVGSTPAAFAAQKDTQVPYAVMSAQALEDAGISLLSQEEENETAPRASTLQAQIDAAEANKETHITLQGDVSEDLTIPADKNIVLELAEGSKLTNKTKTHTIINNGILTITGTGTVDNVSHQCAAVYNARGGVVTLNGGSYTRSNEAGKDKTDSGENSYYNIQNHGEMTINDGVTVSQTGNFSSMIASGFYDGTKETTNPKLVINGGTFSGGMNTIKNDDRGILEINGGTFTNVSQAVLMNWNEAAITGGSFEANAGAEAVIYNGYLNDAMDCGKLTISGGEFTATGSSPVIQQNGNKGIGTVQINDGTFTTGSGKIIGVGAGAKTDVTIVKGQFSTSTQEHMNALNAYIDPSSNFDAASGTVSALPAEQAVASIGAKNYKNFADAVAAVKDNETITLLQEVTLDKTLVVNNGKKFTLDLNEKTLTASLYLRSAFVTATNGKICGDVWLETTDKDQEYNNFTLANDAEIETNGYGIVVTQLKKGADNYGSTVNIQGSVTGKESTLWVLGNITTDLKTAKNPVTVNVGSTAKLTNSDQTNTALQMAGACVVTVEDGAQITGGTAIEVRAGKLTVKGGTITGTGTATEVQPNGNGTSTKGAGIGIAQHTTKQPIEVTISGGKISGHTAFFESNPQKNEGDAQQKIELNIAGGEFTATNGGTNAVSSESGKTNFVTGGTFSSPVDKDYLNGLNAELKANSGDAPYSYYPTVDAAKEAAKKAGGGTVTDLTTPTAKTYTVTLKFANDGETTDQVLTVAENGIVILPTPTRSGRYAFRYWTDGTNTYNVGDAYTVTGNATLTAVWRYTGSSSSGITSSYPVSVPRFDNGSVSVTPGSASKGTTVTITVKPDEGYELNKITVTDKDGNRLSLSDKGDGKYTFTMPDGKVSVDASFSKIVATVNFRDVNQSDYYYDAVQWAVEKGITEGTSATTFGPDASCTRAQMVTFLWRAAGSPAPKSTVNPFTDVSASDYYYNAVLWAVENGITTGVSADRFAPGATVSRAQTVTFLYRANGSPAANGASFGDVAADEYYANAVAWAVQNGITTGTGNGKFTPNAPCTRGQIVTFLYRSSK